MAETSLDIIINAVDNASSKLAGVGKVAGGVALAGVAALGAGIAAVGVAAFDASNQYDAAMDSLVIATGKSGDALDEMGESVKALYAGSGGRGGRGLEDIAKVVGEVSSRMNLAGAPLQAFTDQLFKLSNLTGTDAATNLESVNKLMGQLGVEADDATFFVNELFVATQNTGLGLDDLTASLQTLAPTAQTFGLDTIDLIELIDNLTQAGINSTVANTGLRTALGKLAEDGITPSKKALEDLIEQIAGPDGLNVAMDYFGAKAGPAFFQAVADGSITARSFSGDIDGVTDALDKTTTATDGWEQSWLTIKATITTAIVPLGDLIKNFLDTHGKEFTDWFTANVPGAVKTGMAAIDQWIAKIEEFTSSIPGYSSGADQGGLGAMTDPNLYGSSIARYAAGALRDYAPNDPVGRLLSDQFDRSADALMQQHLRDYGNLDNLGVVNQENIGRGVRNPDAYQGPYPVNVNIYGNATTQDVQDGITQAIQGQGVR